MSPLNIAISYFSFRQREVLLLCILIKRQTFFNTFPLYWRCPIKFFYTPICLRKFGVLFVLVNVCTFQRYGSQNLTYMMFRWHQGALYLLVFMHIYVYMNIYMGIYIYIWKYFLIFSGIFFRKQKGTRVFQWQEDPNAVLLIVLLSTKPCLSFLKL